MVFDSWIIDVRFHSNEPPRIRVDAEIRDAASAKAFLSRIKAEIKKAMPMWEQADD